MNFETFRTQIKTDFVNTINNLTDKQITKLIGSIIPFQFSRFLTTERLKKYFLLLNVNDKKQYLYRVFRDPSTLTTIAKIQSNEELNLFLESNVSRQQYQMIAKLILINSDLSKLQSFISIIPVNDAKEIIISKPNEFKTILLQLSKPQLLPMFNEKFDDSMESYEFIGVL